MKPSQAVAVVGSLNADLVVTVSRLPELGETISGDNFHTFPGGKGANQAVAAAKLGAMVSHVGKVGRDSLGNVLLTSLKEAGVDVSYVEASDSAPTGTALITVDKAGDNTIVVVPGANGECTSEFVEPFLNQMDFGVLILQLEIPMDAVVCAAQTAKAKGAFVILNPAPAAMLPPELMASIGLLVLNETEASLISQVTVTDVPSALEAGRVIGTMGVPEVLVTLGKHGAVYTSANREQVYPAFEVTSVDSTAAGDAFIGGLAASLAGGNDVPTSIDYASAAGALTVTRLGAQSSIPTKPEVEEFLTRMRES